MMNYSDGKNLAVAGAVLHAGPLIGLVGTVVGMVSAFRRMGPDGVGDPEALAGDIGVSLITTAIGLIFSLIGIVLMLIALFGCKYRAPWFFWVLVVVSSLWALNFPFGTLPGLFLLIYLLTQRNEFKQSPSHLSGDAVSSDRQ